ncbi:hypothetical protein DAEQUDRAFT_673721 [Daedalea quercina L-15889]|uniref:Uncharacterized protein n=1 Tax=Daedalea quercina L-15889 TaxID=1314783 RepID=A0A165NPF0_9APHY|nr:hypothetical protein DAEQUDRAFT_673721 [Daedalea quercina L-15889]
MDDDTSAVSVGTPPDRPPHLAGVHPTPRGGRGPPVHDRRGARQVPTRTPDGSTAQLGPPGGCIPPTSANEGPAPRCTGRERPQVPHVTPAGGREGNLLFPEHAVRGRQGHPSAKTARRDSLGPGTNRSIRAHAPGPPG